MQCNFVVDSNGAGAIPRMDKNAAIIGKFTLRLLFLELEINFLVVYLTAKIDLSLKQSLNLLL